MYAKKKSERRKEYGKKGLKKKRKPAVSDHFRPRPLSRKKKEKGENFLEEGGGKRKEGIVKKERPGRFHALSGQLERKGEGRGRSKGKKKGKIKGGKEKAEKPL